MRVAIIAIAKSEERYIKEWLDYHLTLGFNTIIVADNDDDLVLSPYASQNVIIEDFTGVIGVQSKAYTKLYEKYRKDYDWIFFIDIDEFVVFDRDGNVQNFLSHFNNDIETIRLTCKHFTDNEELDVINDNYNVFDRFKTQIVLEKNDRFCKSFINTKVELINNRHIFGHGIYDKTLKAVNARGEEIISLCQKNNEAVYDIAWVNHFRTKTISEYIIQKCYRGGPNNNDRRYSDWMNYFSVTNKLTPEKIARAEELIREIQGNN